MCLAVWFGPPGTGKTTKALVDYGSVAFWKSANTGTWFDGYTGQRVLVLDEFDGNGVPIASLLEWTSGAPSTLQLKGSTVRAAWTTVIVISNMRPERWWTGTVRGVPTPTEQQREALASRIRQGEFEDFTGRPNYRDLGKKIARDKPVADEELDPELHELRATYRESERVFFEKLQVDETSRHEYEQERIMQEVHQTEMDRRTDERRGIAAVRLSIGGIPLLRDPYVDSPLLTVARESFSAVVDEDTQRQKRARHEDATASSAMHELD